MYVFKTCAICITCACVIYPTFKCYYSALNNDLLEILKMRKKLSTFTSKFTIFSVLYSFVLDPNFYLVPFFFLPEKFPLIFLTVKFF